MNTTATRRLPPPRLKYSFPDKKPSPMQKKRKMTTGNSAQAVIPHARYWFEALHQWNHASTAPKVPLKDWYEADRINDHALYSKRKLVAMEVEYYNGMERFNNIYSAGLPDRNGKPVKGVKYLPTRELLTAIRRRRTAEDREGQKTDERVKQLQRERRSGPGLPRVAAGIVCGEFSSKNLSVC
ncbi:hypothetical protein DFS34DRAFT_607042 [Phlyctochytrium arcticum]|nr:hypothetical protein DFS34DRAFT_607042 [Phlyctochytrium arcticum]